jgi:hypothetical protein
MGTTVNTDHQSAQSSFSLQYNETLSAGQMRFVLDAAQTDSTFSEQTGGGSMSMDSKAESAHSFSMHQEATSDPVGQSFAFVSHAYDDARSTSFTSSSGPNSSSNVTTDVYSERMVNGSVGSFTDVRTTTMSGAGMPGNPQTTTITGTFNLNDASHFAPGGPTSGTLALNQVFAQFQALGQQAALDLQKAVQACAASGRDTTGVIVTGLNNVLNQLLPAVQGLPYKLRDMTADRAAKVLLNVNGVIGVSLPAKLMGIANQQQRLETIGDYSTMFLNGMMFGTVESLREESAKLAKKYGEGQTKGTNKGVRTQLVLTGEVTVAKLCRSWADLFVRRWDFLETDRQHPLLRRGLFADAPAQVDNLGPPVGGISPRGLERLAHSARSAPG